MHRLSSPLLGALSAVCFVQAALAGPNEGGALVVHSDPSVEFTSGAEYCFNLALSECGAAVSSTYAISPRVLYVLAAFPASSTPSLKGVTFGIAYDSSSLEIVDWDHCADFSINDPNWPAPNSGIAVSWASSIHTDLVPVYWFAAARYYAPPTTFDLVSHPIHGAVFADDSTPAEEDAVSALGSFGFGTPGYAPCPQELSMPVLAPGDNTYTVLVRDHMTGEPLSGIDVVIREEISGRDCADPACVAICFPPYTQLRTKTATTNSVGVASATFTYMDCQFVGAEPPIYTSTAPYEVHDPILAFDLQGEYLLLDVEPGSAEGVTHVAYVVHESAVAPMFAPVLHKHRYELCADLADFNESLAASGTSLSGYNFLGQRVVHQSPISNLHVTYQDCGDADSYGGGTISIAWQVDLDNAIRYTGAPEGQRPIYYHAFPYEDGILLQYYWWLNVNDLRSIPGPGAYHEGDWEWIAMKIVAEDGVLTPQYINFYNHDGGKTFEPNECWWSSTTYPSYSGMQLGWHPNRSHPHVWVAANSHASYNRGDKTFSLRDVPFQSNYYDLVDFNLLADNASGDHPFFEYDVIVPTGEFFRYDEAHECEWLFDHWQGPFGYSADPSLHTFSFVGLLGERGCPEDVPSWVCALLGYTTYTGSRSPTDAGGSHEWLEFTVGSNGFGNDGDAHIDYLEHSPPRGNYLGEYIVVSDGSGESLDFTVFGEYTYFVSLYEVRVQVTEGDVTMYGADDYDSATSTYVYYFDVPDAWLDDVSFSASEIGGTGALSIDVIVYGYKAGDVEVPLPIEYAVDLKADVLDAQSASVQGTSGTVVTSLSLAWDASSGQVEGLANGCLTSSHLQVFDVGGRLVREAIGTCDGEETRWTIDGAGLGHGIYFAKAGFGREVVRGRLVIAR